MTTPNRGPTDPNDVNPHLAPGLEAVMQRAMRAAKRELPPDVGLCVFAMHVSDAQAITTEPGYIAYGSTVNREDELVSLVGLIYAQDPVAFERAFERYARERFALIPRHTGGTPP